MELGISQSCGSAPSQEIKQIGHLLVLAGIIYLAGSLCGCLCCLGLRPISGPCELCPELIRSRAWKRSKTLALQAEAKLVESHRSARAPCGWPPAGEPNVVNTAPCQMTQLDQPEGVAAVHLGLAGRHPMPV